MADTSPHSQVLTRCKYPRYLCSRSCLQLLRQLSHQALHLARLKSQDAAEIMCLPSCAATFPPTFTSPDSNSNSIGSQSHTVTVRGKVMSARQGAVAKS